MSTATPSRHHNRTNRATKRPAARPVALRRRRRDRARRPAAGRHRPVAARAVRRRDSGHPGGLRRGRPDALDERWPHRGLRVPPDDPGPGPLARVARHVAGRTLRLAVRVGVRARLRVRRPSRSASRPAPPPCTAPTTGLDLEAAFAINNIRIFGYFLSLMLLGGSALGISAAALSGSRSRWLGVFGAVVGVVPAGRSRAGAVEPARPPVTRVDGVVGRPGRDPAAAAAPGGRAEDTTRRRWGRLDPRGLPMTRSARAAVTTLACVVTVGAAWAAAALTLATSRPGQIAIAAGGHCLLPRRRGDRGWPGPGAGSGGAILVGAGSVGRRRAGARPRPDRLRTARPGGGRGAGDGAARQRLAGAGPGRAGLLPRRRAPGRSAPPAPGSLGPAPPVRR